MFYKSILNYEQFISNDTFRNHFGHLIYMLIGIILPERCNFNISNFLYLKKLIYFVIFIKIFQLRLQRE